MAVRGERPSESEAVEVGWLETLAEDVPLGGVAGPGRWLVAAYYPTALFSLKASNATSSVGKTLLVPTAYAVKMALVDAAFRDGLAEERCAHLVRGLCKTKLRIAPPGRAVVTHTFVKVRQEPKKSNADHPYTASIAYREIVHHLGVWRWAFDLGLAGAETASVIIRLCPRINYVGKRGSFVQFAGLQRIDEPGAEYTLPMPPPASWRLPERWHPAILDDFGAEAELAVLSTFAKSQDRAKVKVPEHRQFVHTVVPLGAVSTGPGFTEYAGDEV